MMGDKVEGLKVMHGKLSSDILLLKAFSPRYVGFIALDGRVCKNLGDVDDEAREDLNAGLDCFAVK